MLNHYRYTSVETQAEALALNVAKTIKLILERKNFEQQNHNASVLTDHYSLEKTAPNSIKLAVSGGKSPRLFLEKLSCIDLDWSRIEILLVDDRWVDVTHTDSNFRFIENTLKQNAAINARLWPLIDLKRNPNEQAKLLSTSKMPGLPDIAILGMGDDGHTASLFADAPEWENAINTDYFYVAVSPVAAAHSRISLSLSALKKIEFLFLQFAGESKSTVFNQALHKPSRNAISLLLADQPRNLDVYSC